MMIDPLAYAVQVLAGRCDGARTHDGAGFNKIDSAFGKQLAGVPFSQWTDKQKRAAWRMLKKYEGQLSGAGISYDDIPEPKESGAADLRRIWINGPMIRIAFPYSAKLVDAVRALPGRSWDGVNKHWLLQARPYQAQAAIDFGMQHDFEVSDDLRELAEQYEPQSAGAPAPAAEIEKTIRVEADRIAVHFEYNESIVAEMRNIPGARFDKDDRVWYVPTTPDAISGVDVVARLFKFGGDIDQIASLAEKTKALMQEAIAASQASSAEIEIEGLGGTLRPFQKAGVVYALDKKRLIIGDQMGLGKTVQALATIQAANAYPALVMCPANLKLNWIREARTWLPGKQLQMLGGADSFGRHDADVTVVNYDRLKQYRDYLLKRGFKAVIADESHYLKNGKTARTVQAEEIMSGLSYQREEGGKVNRRSRVRMAPEPEYRILLSGSPVLNRPDELISQLRIIDRLDDFGGWRYFTKTYCDAYGTRFGYSTSGAKNLKELNDKLRATCYVRRLKEDVLKELPPKIRTVVPCEITNRKEYQKAEADLINWLRETKGQAKADAARQAEQLVRIEALKQLAARGKMEAIKEWVEEFVETEEKLVMFAWHKEIVGDLAQTFKCAKITGDTPLAVRDQAVQDFQKDDKVKMLACNVQAGGVGITLTAASNVCFFELGWNPGTMDQAGDRCHRIGQEDSVTEWWFLGKGTIDEDIHQLIEKKRSVVDQATDGKEADNSFSVMNELVARLTNKEERTYDINDDWPSQEEQTLFG